MTTVEDKLPKKNRQRGINRRIGFSQEIVTKEVAKTLLPQDIGASSTKELFLAKLKESSCENKELNTKLKKEIKSKGNKSVSDSIEHINNDESGQKRKHKKDKKGRELSSADIEGKEMNIEDGNLKPKKLKRKKENGTTVTDSNGNNEEISTDKNDSDKTLSKRALKKMKYEKLLEDKKLKIDMAIQQKSLTYLSNWKHDRANWKFEKLKQIWLLQNLYDSSKIDDKSWDNVVEYFSNCKGQAHKTILDDAIKIVEKEQYLTDNNGKIKLKRARDIIQNLQE